jgi:ABC-type transport system involved in cytochrome c biogenesis permease subunit
MNLELIRNFLMWSAILNYCILLLWIGIFILAHDFYKNLNERVFGRTIPYFDTIHYSGIALYKLGIIFFNIIPLIVLSIYL